jgi:hypothetical protein
VHVCPRPLRAGGALLDGDREARKILADLLEEQGDRGLAQWARGGGNAKHRRMEFALMILPCRGAICLAMEFMQHVFTSQADVKYIERTSLMMSKWESAQTSNEDLQVYCEITLRRFGIYVQTTQSQHTIRRATDRNLAFNHLLEALRCAVR